MSRILRFASKEDFLATLRKQIESDREQILDILMPYPLPEAQQLMKVTSSRLKFFAFTGAVTGFASGLLFTSYTVLSWPLIIGGKPLISIPPFLIIAYILTILFGSLACFVGFLWLARLPELPRLVRDEEPMEDGRFAIVLKGESP